MYEAGAARGQTVTLDRLLRRLSSAGLGGERTSADRELEIDHLTDDSRVVGPKGLFVAVRGEQADGRLFIDKAVENGAIAIVYEATPGESHPIAPDVALVPVSDSRRALGVLAAEYFGDPSHSMDVIGVTGTNGKTTTTHLIYQALVLLDPPSALIGTIDYRTPRTRVEASHTTPSALRVHALLDQTRKEAGRSCVMEVSSHALEQGRTEAVRFSGAIFTNLTQDHLDYHVDMDAYFAAKKRLFDGLDANALAIYNADDEAGGRMVSDTSARRVSYGQGEGADIRFEVLESRPDSLRIRLDGRYRMFKLPGRFNAYNVSAAYALLASHGFDAVEVLDALEQARPAPGRFEAVSLRGTRGDVKRGAPMVIVDYAHTPDALRNVLEAVAECKPDGAEVWCVFGCGGDRDRAKRPLMARVAEAGADHIVVTDDNPRTEPSEQIFADIRPGFREPDRVIWQSDRRLAIAAALEGATAGATADVVLVAGKGHETYQVIGTTKNHFDDREVIREIWAGRGSQPTS